jgi:hypothetical protein
MRFNLNWSPRWTLSVSCLVLSWLGMQAVHELGHVAGAWLTGGTIVNVVLHPAAISRTDVAPNPQPLIEIWLGPIVGVVLPLLLWGISSRFAPRTSFVFRFFAGFCLIANGLYIGVGSFDLVGDCGDLIKHGAKVWQLWCFGFVTIPAGLSAWNGLGPHFGWGKQPREVDDRLALGALALLFIVVIAEIIFSGR